MSKSNDKQNLENINNYSVIDIIGTGSFGTCYKVQHKFNNKYYVWKAVDYGSMSLDEKKLLVTEVNLIGTLKHPHIVRYFGRIIHQISGTLYIITEWCERGDLNSLINDFRSKNIRINEKFVWKVLYQTAKALEACHSLFNEVTVLHRDIKPANIFLDKDYNVKLGDFGLAKILLNNVSFSSTVVGTPYYMSPEQILGSKYNKKTDVWSLGCLIHEMCSLTQPFNGHDLKELKENITKNRLFRIPSRYSNYLDKMVKLLLSSNHEFRPSVEMIIHHPTVICNYDNTATPFPKPETNHNGDGDFLNRRTRILSSNTNKCSELTENNIDEIIQKIERFSKKNRQNIESDPQTITEEVYNRKLMSRLKLLREKESLLKAKEDSLKTKEFLLKTRESTLLRKQKQIEKREREIETVSYQRTCSRQKLERNRVSADPGSVDQLKQKRENRKSFDLDSTTCSADPGDTSFTPTAAKLDPLKIVKPAFFKNRQPELKAGETNRISITDDSDEHEPGGRNKNIKENHSRVPLTFSTCHKFPQLSSKNKPVSVMKYQNYIYKK